MPGHSEATAMTDESSKDWPALTYADWRDTCDTLRLWTQIVGKIRLARTPWLNHGWHVTLYVTARGLSTSPIPYDTRSFEMEFDFQEHVLDIRVSDHRSRQLELRPRSVANFHAAILAALDELGIPVRIDDYPCEIEGAIHFSSDETHASYDAEYAHRFWRVLRQVDRLFKEFRTGFLGKSSPVHFFWGSFDLAVTRFSGRLAPLYSGRTPGVSVAVMREAYSHDVSSAGFWPGGQGADDASFYSYAYPTPPGFQKSTVKPQGTYFNEDLGQFLLPYELVRTSRDPDAAVLAFLQSTYEAAAVPAGWDRAALECPLGKPGVPRETG
jgi:hypothetical protein